MTINFPNAFHHFTFIKHFDCHQHISHFIKYFDSHQHMYISPVYTDIRRNGQPLSVGQGEELVVIQHRVEVLHPLRVHISIKDDPLTLAYLSTHIVYDPTYNMYQVIELGH